MQLEHILQAHGLIGRGGGQATPLPIILNFTGQSNALGNSITINWENPDVLEFQKVQIFMSETDISNLSYDYLVANGNLIVNEKKETHVVTGLIHNDTRHFKAFGVFSILGEEEVSSGVNLVVTTKDIVPPATITNFAAKGDDTTVELDWTNPADSDFSKVKIMYKQGGYPTSHIDGTLAYEGSGTNKLVIGLVNDTDYYFRAFTFDTSGNINSNIANQQIIATPSEIKIYGIEIDESNSNSETAVTYTDDAVGFTPASGNNGAFNWGSWEDIIKDEFMIRPCVLNNPAKTVNYYLNYDNYNLKATGGASVLTGADGDVMVEFGQELWWKFSRVGSQLKIQLSTKAFDGAVNHAFDIEEGYNQLSFYPLTLLQILFLVIFKNRDTQTALGRGYVDGNSAYLNTGTSNNRPFIYGETTGKQQMKFLGIEDYWGNRRQWIDGCFYDTSRNMMIGKTNFNDTGAGYTNNGVAMSANGSGYIDTIQGGNNTGFIPKSFGGSATTHYSDYGDVVGGELPYFGGSRSDGDYAGGFSLYSSTAASSYATVGGRLVALLGKKLYIGVYLGVTVSGKLRSVSGQVSENAKTIGNFRTLAKANN